VIPPRNFTFINIPSPGTRDNPLGGNVGMCNEFRCMGTHLGDSLKHHYTMCMVPVFAPTVYSYNQPFSATLPTYATSPSVATADVLPLCHLNSQSVNTVSTLPPIPYMSTSVPQTYAAIMPCACRNLITVEISSCLHILSQITNIQSKPFLTHCPSCTLYTTNNLGRIFKSKQLLVHHL